MLAGAMVLSMAGCSGSADSSENAGGSEDASSGDSSTDGEAEETEIQVFIAASLNTVMTELAEMYNEEHPEVTITYNPDSSGTLLTQIQEGYECDIFFSAAQKQMDDLEADGLMVEGTRADVVNNQVVVVSLKDSGTKVTGLENLNEAESIALAGGSVPVGRYTRQALVNLGTLPETDDPASITTEQVSEALGGVEISLDILQTVSYDLTGDVIYPIARVVNEEADDAQTAAAEDFLKFILSDEAKAVFESYYFDTNV